MAAAGRRRADLRGGGGVGGGDGRRGGFDVNLFLFFSAMRVCVGEGMRWVDGRWDSCRQQDWRKKPCNAIRLPKKRRWRWARRVPTAGFGVAWRRGAAGVGGESTRQGGGGGQVDDDDERRKYLGMISWVFLVTRRGVASTRDFLNPDASSSPRLPSVDCMTGQGMMILRKRYSEFITIY
jgi:hypothetical protein